MNEISRGLLGIPAALITLTGSTIWWLGGRPKGRLFRRLAFPLIFPGLVCLLAFLVGTFNYLMLISIPAYFIASITGYGGEDLWTKIRRRTLWSIAITLASIPIAAATGMWILIIAQFMVSLSTSLLIGTTSTLEAPLEEGMIAFASIMFVPFMAI